MVTTTTSSAPVVAVATPVAAANVVGAYIPPLVDTSTGPSLRQVGCYFNDTIFELYPDINYQGWDLDPTSPTYLQCISKRTNIPVLPDGESATITPDMVCFYQDRSVTQELDWNGLKYTKSVFDTDKNGAKSIIFCEQRNGGQKQWAFESFRVFDGTYLMLTSCDPGQRGQPNNKAKGFMLGRQNVMNINSLFQIYPELAAGNTGIFFTGWTQDLDFEVTCLDDDEWDNQMKLRREACLDLAMGGVKLTYDDGTPVNDEKGVQVVGRWDYLIEADYTGTLVIDPNTNMPIINVDTTTGKPLYRKCSGWGLDFAYGSQYCSWDGSVSTLKPPIASFIANSFSTVSVTDAATGQQVGSINGANTLDATGNADGTTTIYGALANGIDLTTGATTTSTNTGTVAVTNATVPVGLSTGAPGVATTASGQVANATMVNGQYQATATPSAGAAVSTSTTDPSQTTYKDTTGTTQTTYATATPSQGLTTVPVNNPTTLGGSGGISTQVTATSNPASQGATVATGGVNAGATTYVTPPAPSAATQAALAAADAQSSAAATTSGFKPFREWYRSGFNPSSMLRYVEMS
jgi:hypothetical protein